MSKFLAIGSDAEYFVRDRNGRVRHAIGLVGGTKEKPLLVEGGNFQEDCTLAEMAIDPCVTKEEWIKKMTSVRLQLAEHMAKHNLTLSSQASYNYLMDELINYPPSAMILGCQPDQCVYTNMPNPQPDPFTGLRSAGAHVHFSYENPNMETTAKCILMLDYTLGVWSVLMDPDRRRRHLYGQAGSYRLKEYGGEYRSLPPFWTDNRLMMGYVYDVTRWVVENVEEKFEEILATSPTETVQHNINTHRQAMCRSIKAKVDKILPEEYVWQVS
jgi:hypothetical protein